MQYLNIFLSSKYKHSALLAGTDFFRGFLSIIFYHKFIKMKNFIIISTIVCFLSVSCNHSKKSDHNGMWRGVFVTPSHEIPFLFEISGSENTTVTLINGEERIMLEHVYHRNDSIFIPIPAYDAILAGKIEDEIINGELIRLYSDNRVSFTAQKGNFTRFPVNGTAPSHSLDGKWEITVLKDSAKQVGIFIQKGNNLTGSILTLTGDYRYLDGITQGDNFYLSTFGGLTPYLIQGEFQDSDNFTAEFITPGGSFSFNGKRNPKANLPDAYALTSLNEGYMSLGFSLPNMNGNSISLSDPKFANKVVIVSILGSWCPNCLDEAAFLAPWYHQNKQRGVEIVGLAFERKDDFDYAKKQLSRLIDHYKIGYDILFAGKVGNESTNKVLPELKKVVSYPTTIFIDKKGTVRKIHTGFNGPATGEYYDEFQKEFNWTVDDLLNE